MTVSELPHNAVVVFRRPPDEAPSDEYGTDGAVREFVEALRHLGRSDVIVAVVDHDQDLAVMDEDLMRTHGWVRTG